MRAVSGASRDRLILVRVLSCAAAGFVFGRGGPAHAVDWRSTVDARVQTVAFRGVQLDSIPASDVVTLPNGSLVTPDGFAVTLRPGEAYATFFRPGPENESTPYGAVIDLSAWDLGVTGLRVQANGRIFGDAKDGGWPGTTPSGRLHEGFAEWAAPWATVRAGRVHETSRFGFIGFDGAGAEVRMAKRRVSLRGSAGWALTRGEDLPPTSAVLDPLGEFLPEQRSIHASAGASVRAARGEFNAVYIRQLDPRVDDLVTERIGATGLLRAVGLEWSAGSDWDLASRFWGSAEASLAYRSNVASVEFEARRVRPSFPLWTIWGAFSPVPYHAAGASARARTWKGLELRASGERWEFDDPEAISPLVNVEDQGWRWSAGAAWIEPRVWDAGFTLWREHGPGASGLGYEGNASWAPSPAWRASLGGSYLQRQLEFRFDEANVLTWRGRLAWEPGGRLRIAADVLHVDEERERPDAAAFDWSQWRFAFSTSTTFGSAPKSSVPPAVLRIPEAPR